MSRTKTTPTTFFGLWQDGYKAADDKGHAGYGWTKEHANDALREAQAHDLTFAEKASLTGIFWHGPEKED